jgi:hypothetical protein
MLEIFARDKHSTLLSPFIFFVSNEWAQKARVLLERFAKDKHLSLMDQLIFL